MNVLKLCDDRVSWRDVQGEIVGLDLRGSTYFGANPAGSLLWPLLARGATRSELAEALVDAFAIDADQAASDVETFLVDLNRRGLLEC